ncbi:hypothetical protein GWI33_022823 [Rhynchophorus ferrugineus]|uniref:Uncharacterized protein n=1 Tax=Rhynchophorus ferrugineus TaxID=354439 RepID=A0A834J008_RHYFE|nr:hypothetical protein GWI33_022823 [Rhynchophorus ferrugineus]
MKPLRISKPKEPKKLIIKKKGNNHNDSVKDTTKKSQKSKCRKNLFKSCTSIQNEENPIKVIKTNMKGNQEALIIPSHNIIDLTEINDSLKNINGCVSDENVFHIATQKTAESVEQRSYHFPPVSENINDIYSLINILSENVNKLLEESKNFNDEVSLNLVTCFTNLKTYIKRLHQLNSEQKQEVHLVPKVKINISTQTKHVKHDKQMQTSQTSFKEMIFKTLNNSQNCMILTNTNNSKKDKESAIIKNVLKSIHPVNMNSAIDMKASQKTQSSVLLCSLKSSEIRVPKKKVNRRLFGDDNVREAKRIHQLSKDNYDEDGPAKRIKIISDDLTVELEDSENINESDMSEIDLGESGSSEDKNYYDNLLEPMKKLKTPQKQICRRTDNNGILHKKTTGKSDREKDQQNDGNGLFRSSEKDQKSRNLNIAVNTECDVIDNIPNVQPAKRLKFLDSKSKNNKTSLSELDKQILNKDSASNDKYRYDNINSAIDMKASQKTQSSVILCSLKLSEIRVPKKKVNRRLFDDDNAREAKRIHQLSNDNYGEDGPAKRIKLIRDDLIVELEDSKYISESDMSEIDLGESDSSEDMDYYNYLFEVMEKYETPQKQIYRCTDNKVIPHKKTTGKSDREKDQQHEGNGLFSSSEKDQKSRNIASNTECDVIENTPTVQPAKKSKFLDSKSSNNKTSLSELDKLVLNKDSASNDKIVSDDLFSVLLQHDKSTEDAPNIIKNEKHVFSERFEELQTKRNEEMQKTQKRLTQSIDEFLKEIGIDNADDKEIERELESIHFTAEMNKLKEKDNSKILISQNVKIPESGIDRDKDIINTIIISDDSETEVVETSLQKKKELSFNRTPVVNLEQSNLISKILPPPPGFGDDVEDISLQLERYVLLIF